MYKTFGYDGRNFAGYFYFQKWSFIQIGIHLSLKPLNVELHVPFGFFRLGWIDENNFASDGWLWGKRPPLVDRWVIGDE